MSRRIEEHPILSPMQAKKVTFTFESQVLEGLENEPISVALLANGIQVLREHKGRKRGIFCAIGNCSSCLMEVNGVPNVRVCVEPLKEGTVVKLQRGSGSFLQEVKENGVL